MPTLTIRQGDLCAQIHFEGTPALDDVLARAGFAVPKPCGGRGICGKCAVRAEGGVSQPSDAEIRAGARLSCQMRLIGDCAVEIPPVRAAAIETGGVRPMRRGMPMPGRYGAAVDIGTTTLALRVEDLASGALIGAASALNPQISVAADVMGRIGAAMRGEGGKLRAQAVGAVEHLIAEGSRAAGIDPAQIEVLVVCANTTMLTLLTGRDAEPLSRAPFVADHLFGEWTALLGRRAYLPPCMHAFVGADITCAVLASGICERPGISLLCDIGTNGEIALWKDGALFVASTAAGPAFEGAGISCGCGGVVGAVDRVWVDGGRLGAHTIGGAAPVGVCGSGLIDAVAALLHLGAIDETGATAAERLPILGDVALLPADIRAVQLAKAAVAAGMLTLLEAAEVDPRDVDVLYIAGGFGSHLNVESAAAIGLIPRALAARATAIGNAALGGAEGMLLDQSLLGAAGDIARGARHVALGGNPRFNAHYVEQMLFPEND